MRRNFLVNLLLWVLAFFFGYTIKKEGENLSLFKTDVRKSPNQDWKNIQHKIENLNSQLADISTNVKQFGAVGDGVADDTAAFQMAIDTVINGKEIFVPDGVYKISNSLILQPNTKIIGQGIKNTHLNFQGVSGFIGDDVDNISIKSMKIKDVAKATDTVGISLLNYCNYHYLDDLFIEGFGKWAVYQQGGLDYKYERIDTLDNGKRTTLVNQGGSIFIDKGPLGSTTGFFNNIYLRNGGYYGLKLDRMVNITAINFIVEYHVKPLYAFASTGVMVNFYEEANTHATEKVHLHDSGIVMINYRGQKPVRTYDGAAFESRDGVTIDKDVTARYLYAQQYHLKNSRSMNPHVEGALSLSSDGFPRYSKGGQWYKLRGLTTHELYAATATTFSYNLGKVQQNTSCEIEVNLTSSALLSQRYHYKKFLLNTGASSNTQYNLYTIESVVNTTTPFIKKDASVSVDINNDLIFTFTTLGVETLGTVSLNNKRGSRVLTPM